LTTRKPFVDYHFHPNFRVPSRWRAKAQRIWEGFKLTRLDAVVVCEHSYKNPVDTFHALERTRPHGNHTVLLPGVEILTKEGLDVVVFGENSKWYEDPHYERLLRPYGPTIGDVIGVLNQSDHLAGYLPHPFTCGTTGAVRNYGPERARQLANQLGGVEASNNSYSDTIHISERVGGHRWFPTTFGRMRQTQQLHEDFMQGLDVGFFAIGSDAHFPEELGHGVELETGGHVPTSSADAFHQMRTNRVHVGVSKDRKMLASVLYHCSISAIITGDEYLQKMRIRAALRRSNQPATDPVPGHGVETEQA